MSAIASTRVVLAARQSTLGRGRERRESRRISPVDGIAARSRIADGATLRVTTKIAGVPTRRARDGARCLAGPEQLFQLADGGGLSPIVPLLSILGGFAIARTLSRKLGQAREDQQASGVALSLAAEADRTAAERRRDAGDVAADGGDGGWDGSAAQSADLSEYDVGMW